jgi:hypothetical protein
MINPETKTESSSGSKKTMWKLSILKNTQNLIIMGHNIIIQYKTPHVISGKRREIRETKFMSTK